MSFKLNLDTIVPVLIVGLFVYLFAFNNKTPTKTENGNTIIKPEHHTQWFADSNSDIPSDYDHDNHYIFKHKESNESLDLLERDGYLIIPDGKSTLPKKKDPQTGIEKDIWEVTHVKRDIIFDTRGWDIGTYAGFIDGNKSGTTIKDFDFGLRVSPLKIYNTFATDLLISNQDAGFGISFYPMPIRYGEIWHHIGLGYGRVMDYEVKDQHNIFYLSFSTKF